MSHKQIRIKSFFLVSLTLCLLTQNALCSTFPEIASDSTKSKSCAVLQLAGKVANNGMQIATSPAKWKAKQWITFGAMAGTGILLYSQDQRIQQFAVKHQYPSLTSTVKYGIEPWGSGIYSSILIGSLYTGARLSNNKRLETTSLSSAESFVIASLFTQFFKHTIHRHRPYQNENPTKNNFEGPFKGFSFTSLPSGHSTAAFSIASVFACEYKETIWVPVLAYSLASTVALSRIYDNKHWASDAFLGSCIGLYTGIMTYKINKTKLNKLNITPQLGNNFSAIVFYYSF